MAQTNRSLHQARSAKRNEYYTQLADIENEMKYYKKYFRGKVVLCNCDDPFESNFFKYFVLNFNRLGLKKLIATCYTGSPIAGTQLSFADLGKEFVGSERAYKAIVTEVYDATGNGGVDMLDVAELFKLGKNTIEELEGDGDFRSAECLALMDEADLVVTNPPFSLFREYVATLLEHQKQFIIIGNLNDLTYKDTFPLIRDNQLWVGYTKPKEFVVPKDYPDRKNTYVREDGTIIAKFGYMVWFTNLDIKKRHEDIVLFRRFDADYYPHYENYDGIDVNDVTQIPCDYAGVMGVPISFFERYNPDQFEIIGFGKGALAASVGVTKNYRGRSDLAYIKKDGTHKGVYCHVLIRNKHPEQPKA